MVYRFGAITGQTSDGLVLTAPWEALKEANVQVQRHKFEDLAAASSETQDVFIDVSLNYQVSPTFVQTLYRTVGTDYFERLVVGRINQLFKDETVQYTAIDVTRKRDEISAAVGKRLSDELAPYSITVVALLIDNISYSDAFNAAIEEKQVATQNALRAQEQVKQKEFEAQQVAASAKGEADALRIRAEGQAAANRLVSQSLTPEIIQYEAVQRLTDKVQIALVPSGQGIIIDPSTLLAPRRP